MPRISVFYGIVVYMNWREHQPAHFHAVYAEWDASIEIDPIRVMRGTLPPRALSMVLDWAGLHQDELRVNWDLAQSLAPLAPIPPLP